MSAKPIRKSVISEAKLDYDEIKNFAINSAKKELEESVDKTLKNMINKELNEDIDLEVGDTKLTLSTASTDEVPIVIKKDGEEILSDVIGGAEGFGDGIEGDSEDLDDDGGFEVDGDDMDDMGDGEEDMDDEDPIDMSDDEGEDIDMSAGSEDGDSIEISGDDESMDDETSDDEDFEVGDEDSEDEEIEENLFEIISEEEVMPQAAPTPAADPTQTTPADAPVADAGAEASPNAGADMSTIADKLDQLIAVMGGQAPADPAAGEEIQIVDDSATTAPPAAPAPAAAPVMEEFNFDSKEADMAEPDAREDMGPDSEYLDLDNTEDPDLDEDFNFFEEDNTLGVAEEEFNFEESVEEEFNFEENTVEEMGGTSFPVQRGSNQRKDRMSGDKHHAPQAQTLAESENKLKTQYDAKLAGLRKENRGLISEVEDFKNSFVELRRQFNESQTFNAKLAFLNKLLIGGAIGGEDKMRLAEEFDKTKTVEEAEKLYKTILKEGRVTNVKTIQNTKKIGATSSKAAQPKALYESAEAKRWKVLGGIDKQIED